MLKAGRAGNRLGLSTRLESIEEEWTVPEGKPSQAQLPQKPLITRAVSRVFKDRRQTEVFQKAATLAKRRETLPSQGLHMSPAASLQLGKGESV